jgi:hypothetical protein
MDTRTRCGHGEYSHGRCGEMTCWNYVAKHEWPAEVLSACLSTAHNKINCQEAGLLPDDWCVMCERRFGGSVCSGDPDGDTLEESQWLRFRDATAAHNREQFPDGCVLCGEPADAEMGEFAREDGNGSVVAHAQCGIDRGLELA